jgi:Cytochrome c554 and c-prime
MTQAGKKSLALASLAFWAVIPLGSSSLTTGQIQSQRNPLSEWRPTDDSPGIRYVGTRVCAQCHKQKAATQLATPMAHALEPASECEVLSQRLRMTFREGAYSYQILRQDSRSIYTVSDGVNTISEPILYCFGRGRAGQTYVLQHNGVLYEGRLSYYQSIQALDLTIGQPTTVPASLEEALGRRLSGTEAVDCFRCHAPSAVSEQKLRLENLVPGVTCEACHGPGEMHIAAVNSRDSKGPQIFNPRTLDSVTLSQEFCGTCHRSFVQVMQMPAQGGFQNVRFQPYRIFNSKGHNQFDSRISCIACHDPHDKLQHEASYYDSKCLACHLSNPQQAKTETRTARACPAGTQKCATCHMPKIEIPGTHTGFTDHWIRIVKPNERIPR